MPITVFEAETILEDRAGKALEQVGKEPTVTAGIPSAVYRDALREGLAALGLVPASFSAITDLDLAQVADRCVAKLLDVATLHLFGAASGAFTAVDETVLTGSVKVSQNRAGIDAKYASLADYCRLVHGYGMARLRSGSFNLDRACDTREI